MSELLAEICSPGHTELEGIVPTRLNDWRIAWLNLLGVKVPDILLICHGLLHTFGQLSMLHLEYKGEG